MQEKINKNIKLYSNFEKLNEIEQQEILDYCYSNRNFSYYNIAIFNKYIENFKNDFLKYLSKVDFNNSLLFSCIGLVFENNVDQLNNDFYKTLYSRLFYKFNDIINNELQRDNLLFVLLNLNPDKQIKPYCEDEFYITLLKFINDNGNMKEDLKKKFLQYYDSNSNNKNEITFFEFLEYNMKLQFMEIGKADIKIGNIESKDKEYKTKLLKKAKERERDMLIAKEKQPSATKEVANRENFVKKYLNNAASINSKEGTNR